MDTVGLSHSKMMLTYLPFLTCLIKSRTTSRLISDKSEISFEMPALTLFASGNVQHGIMSRKPNNFKAGNRGRSSELEGMENRPAKTVIPGINSVTNSFGNVLVYDMSRN